jgi:hypothetical protein
MRINRDAMSEASFRESVSDDYFDLKTRIHDSTCPS